MGFNTVVLILNDHMDSIERAPHSLAWALTHPPMSDNEREMSQWWESVAYVAKKHGESPVALRGGLKVMPTFHADNVHYLRAGQNLIERVDPATGKKVQ